MREFNAVKIENFSLANFRLVNVGFSISSTSLDRVIDRTRCDYYLFYVFSGKVIVDFNNKNATTLSKGDFYLYTPNSQQNYCIDGTAKTKILWVNFLGSEIDELISSLNLTEGKINVRPASTAPEIFSKLLKENVSKNKAYEIMSKSLLFSLLITLSRDKILSNAKTALDKNTSSMITKIISLINENPRITNSELAESVDLSTDHFVRTFKKIFKVTPHKYKLQIIIDSAKNLLTQSDLTINQIAETLGYENDGLYFNASFKKHVGLSPTEYREKFKTDY